MKSKNKNEKNSELIENKDIDSPSLNSVEENPIREVIIEKKVGFNLIEVIIIMIITILFGVLIGSAITYTKENTNKHNMPPELKEFTETYNNIINNYYEEVDKAKLLDAGIKGMIDYLGDPYSTYMDVAASDSFNQKVNGSYEGIGCEIAYVEQKMTIANCFANAPGTKAGLKKGDEIIAINNKSVKEMAYSDITNNIKGKNGTKVKLNIQRETEIIEMEITRSKVDLISVTSSIFEQENKKVGYLKINIFAANTKDQFQKALNDLEKEGITSLLIDVRDNPGGHLSQVSEILSLFLDKNQIMYKVDTKGKIKDYYAFGKDKKTYPVGVLINEESASASEILAAAMQESYKATLIGKNTYGKGTVQEAYELNDGSTIKYTTKKWLTPNNICINKIGIKPDIEVPQNDAYYQNPNKDNDNQLQKGLEIMFTK